jgi:CTP synthase (UTP-ammonia lyase)
VIALVGKYTGLEDAYASVLKALNHAALFCKRKLTIRVRSNGFISIEFKFLII